MREEEVEEKNIRLKGQVQSLKSELGAAQATIRDLEAQAENARMVRAYTRVCQASPPEDLLESSWRQALIKPTRSFPLSQELEESEARCRVAEVAASALEEEMEGLLAERGGGAGSAGAHSSALNCPNHFCGLLREENQGLRTEVVRLLGVVNRLEEQEHGRVRELAEGRER